MGMGWGFCPLSESTWGVGSKVECAGGGEGDAGAGAKEKLHPPLSHQPGEGNGTPLQYSCLENPMDGGAW